MKYLLILLIILLQSLVFSQSISTPVFVHKDGEASITNFSGTDKDLYVNGTGQQSVGWITFQSSSIDTTHVSAATLLLYVKNVTTPGTLKLYALNVEVTAPENNLPLSLISSESIPIASLYIGINEIEKVIKIDLTSKIKQGAFKGVKLASDDGLVAFFDSKEGHLAPIIMLTHQISDIASKWLSDNTNPIQSLGKNGDYFLNTSSGDVFTKQLNTWNKISNLVGNTGPKGEKGDTGVQGLIGLQGPKGDSGIQGPVGISGPKGDTGLMGSKGDTGTQGAMGPQGPKGDIGLTGSKGDLGPNLVDTNTIIAQKVVGYSALKQTTLDSIVIYLKKYFTPNSIKQVSPSMHRTMILKTDGSLWGVGANFYGELGDGTTINKLSPVQVLNMGSGVKSVFAGTFHTLILKDDGTLWAVGRNDYGQLGDSTWINKSIAVPVKNMQNNIQTVGTSTNFSFVIKNDGSLWAFGYNYFGQLGDGTNTNRQVPVMITSMGTNVLSISTGNNHSLILKKDSSLWSAGQNSGGQLGIGNNTLPSINSPVSVLNMSSGVKKISAGGVHNLVIKNDGSLWAFGTNTIGQIGDTNCTQCYTPTRVLNIDSNVVDICAGIEHSLILKKDGSAWAMGTNIMGTLGNGTNSIAYVPTLVPSMNSGVNKIITGGYRSYFIKDTDSFWGTGDNGYGQLWDGTVNNKNLPILLYPSF